jgi:predicted outer membrane repeat protein
MKKSSKTILATVLLAFIVMGFCLAKFTNAEVIFVGGDVSGVWSADTVMVADSVRVPPGETLTIMPGVEVCFLDYFRFIVDSGAELIAVGTATDTIKFVPFLPGDRSLGLDFINASDLTTLEYCHISRAITSGIECVNSNITIRNCLIDSCEAGTGSFGGGAIELTNNSNPTIENCVLRGNFSAGYGGAIYCNSSSPTIRDNIIADNIAGYYSHAYGGGIACVNHSSPMIERNQIENNVVQASGSFFVRNGRGGGIYCSDGSNPMIVGNMIAGNTVRNEPQTTSNGGGIYCSGSDPMMHNNIIVNNSAAGNSGGGIYFYNSSPVLTNELISRNYAGEYGGGIFVDGVSTLVINNTIIWGDSAFMTGDGIFMEFPAVAVISYSDVQDSVLQGTGNLSVDPLFRDPDNGDFHLMAIDCGDLNDSPCIDTGDPALIDSLLDCNWGLGSVSSDMGPYGGAASAPVGIVDYELQLPRETNLSQNYPNPFNAETIIEYILPVAAHVNLDIYDLLGRHVAALVDSDQDAGTYRVAWRGTDSPSGVYFYRVRTASYSESKSMTLLK